MLGYIVSERYAIDFQTALPEAQVQRVLQSKKDEEDLFTSLVQVKLDTLVIDISSFKHEQLLNGIKIVRLQRPEMRLILVAPNKVPGDATLTAAVSMGVHDILAPEIDYDEDEQRVPFDQDLRNLYENPANYADAARWHTSLEVSIKPTKEKVEKEKKDKEVKEKKEKEAPIIPQIEDDYIPDIPVQEKVVVQDRIIGAIFIGIAGVDRKTGSTHLSLMIANYLAKNGQKVAVVEANQSNDLFAIEYAFEGGRGYNTPNQVFNIKGIDHYKRVDQLNIQLLISKYDYIILDIGSEKNTKYFSEWSRAHVQILTGHGSEWGQKHFKPFKEKYQEEDQTNWIVAVPFVEEFVIKDLENEYEEWVFTNVPSHPDPYHDSEEADFAIEDLLSGYLPETISPSSLSNTKLIPFISVAAAVITIVMLAFIFF